jgi:hypothetical protein
MTEKDYRVERLTLDVREKEIRIRDAKEELDQGYLRLKADFEKEYAKLKSGYERACLELERYKSFLAQAQEEAAKEF